MADSRSSHDEENREHWFALPQGTRLQEFEIKGVLGHGGFGITYHAFDTHLQEDVAIKEYLPNDLAVRVSDATVRAKTSGDQKIFSQGLEAFLEEARMIARFRHPNIMQVRRFFELHGTGYIVLGYERGRTLSQRLKAGPISEGELRSMLAQLLDGLAAVHDRGILHRDLKPNNIILREDGSPVLIDFGAARDFTSRHSRSVTAIAAPGYSPPEQYGVGGQQGPWTDLYALGAIAYRCVTGNPPVDSLRRLRNDPLVPASVAAAQRFSPDLLAAIDWMLQVDESNRPGSVAELRERLSDGTHTLPRQREPAPFLVRPQGAGLAMLQFEQKTAADVLELAFFVSPPGLYLAPSKGSQAQWTAQPHYFSVERAEGSSDQQGFIVGPEVCSFIPADAQVKVSSSDNYIQGKAVWPKLLPAAPEISQKKTFPKWPIVIGAILVAGGAVAMSLGKISDTSCDMLGALCRADHRALEETRICIGQTNSCNVSSCTNEFKTLFPESRLLPRLAAMEKQASLLCESDERTTYERATACASTKASSASCEIAACFSDYLSKFPAGRFAAEVNQRVARGSATCSDAEMRVLEAAKQCALDTPCAAEQCFSDYRSQFASGRHRSQASAAIQGAQQACLVQRTPGTSIQNDPSQTSNTVEPARSEPPRALPNGVYNAERGYTGSRSRSDPVNCPPSTSFLVKIEDELLSFEGQEMNASGPYMRRWLGSINQTNGIIAVRGSDASPPTRNPLTITGHFGSASIESNYCGSGYFRILRN